MTKTEAEHLFGEMAAKESDEDKIRFVIEHKEHFMFLLDNDITSIYLSDEKISEALDYPCIDLDDYFGWDDGILTLLKAVGVKAERC